MNKNGAGVYLTVNETKGGRKIEHLVGIRAVWCEWDREEPPPDWPIAPHIIAETSPHKFHIYWLTADTTPPDHRRIMEAMCGKWGSDESAKDATRVLRIPGFIHRKVDTRKGLVGIPWQVKLIAAESRGALPPYTSARLIKEFGVEGWKEEQHEKAQKEEEAKAKAQGKAKPKESRGQRPPSMSAR